MAFLRSASGLVFGLVFPIVHSFVSTRPQPQVLFFNPGICENEHHFRFFSHVLKMSRATRLKHAKLTRGRSRFFGQQTTTSLRVLGDRPDVSTGEDFQGPPPALLGESSFAIYDLLLQRSLQTHCYYLREARNDVKADWLMGFLDHSHLDGWSSEKQLYSSAIACFF